MKSVSILCILMLFLCGGVYAEHTIWYVHPDSALNTIQAGLDSCAANDIVLVGPGIYCENIVWPNTQGIHLVSELGPETTSIDGDSVGRVMRISMGVDSATSIIGFTIRNGYLTGNNDHGAGIYCDNSSPTITNNIITGNRVSGHAFGGGIACLGNSSPIITCNIITDNGGGEHDGVMGGGVACSDNSAPFITGNNISGNYATVAGGGIYCTSNSVPTITNNVIADNSTSACMCGWIGGGIACYGSASIITGNMITGNYANDGGGIGCENSKSLVNGNRITGNTGNCGGGIYCWGSSPAIINNTIRNDTASYYGGGIFCYQSSPTINCNIISENVMWLTGVGGGILCVGSSPIISSCIICNNNKEGVYCRPDLMGNVSTPVIRNNDIYDNAGFGVCNIDSTIVVSADSNWWGDASGPYHPTANPGGLGDTVSDYVDFDPWLYWPVGVEERPIAKPVEIHEHLAATIFCGSLQLPRGKKCKVFDITGRVVEPGKIQPGIYFIEVDGVVTQKVVKVR